MMNLLVQNILVALVVNTIKLIVIFYTTITLPFYYLLQKPWQRLKIAQTCGVNFVQHGRFSKDAPNLLSNAEFLEFERFVEIPQHPLMKCNTVIEAIYARTEIYPINQPSIGYRIVLEEEIQRDHSGNPIRIDGKVLRKYKLSNYKWITYGDFLEQMEATSRGMISIGLKKYDPIAIYSETGIDFMTAIIASAKSGALIVTVFHTLTDQGLIHAINETKVKFMFVSFELLDRVFGFIKQCPTLKTIIYFEGPQKQKILKFDADIKVYTLNQVKNLGHLEPYKHINPDSLNSEDLFGVMYTSGTTGIPKGVKITQRQMKEAAMAIGQVVRDVIMTGPNHTYIAYLPQAHVLEFSLELFLFLGGVKIGYATPFTLNESAPGLANGQICDLQLLKPTIITAVPMVLDRMQKEIYNKLQQRTPFSKAIFDYLMGYKAYWICKGYKTPIVNWMVCKKVQQQFGGKLKYMVVGGAPLAAKLQKQIKCALNVILIQGYGSTETSGGVFSMDFNDLSFGRVGTPLNGVRVRMVDWRESNYSILDKPNPRGELVIGGKMISNGYLNLEEQNRESFFDEDGYHWFITGDIAEVYTDGTFRIIDRKKDIVKLANGEFISLGKIEAILKSSHYVDNICIVPNGILNCLVALVLPNMPSIKNLAKRLWDIKQQKQISMVKEDLENIIRNKEIEQIIHDDIIAVGSLQCLKSIELPSMIYLCKEIWSPDNNLLTAAMKLKRVNIIKYYSVELENMWLALKADPSKIRLTKK